MGCWDITTTETKNPICHGQILLKLIREMNRNTFDDILLKDLKKIGWSPPQ
jgi:hypothetical protein